MWAGCPTLDSIKINYLTERIRQCCYFSKQKYYQVFNCHTVLGCSYTFWRPFFPTNQCLYLGSECGKTSSDPNRTLLYNYAILFNFSYCLVVRQAIFSPKKGWSTHAPQYFSQNFQGQKKKSPFYAILFYYLYILCVPVHVLGSLNFGQ